MSTLEPLLVSVDQAMAAIGCGKTTFYELLAEGKVRAVKQGRRTLVRVESLRDYAAALPDMHPAA